MHETASKNREKIAILNQLRFGFGNEKNVYIRKL